MNEINPHDSESLPSLSRQRRHRLREESSVESEKVGSGNTQWVVVSVRKHLEAVPVLYTKPSRCEVMFLQWFFL